MLIVIVNIKYLDSNHTPYSLVAQMVLLRNRNVIQKNA